ncbi:MAG: peptidoglycan endopeptidase [Rhodanobacter sp.]|nr:MAG: peptidoglycan endopeptidase [Rhodanobacter sp.]TAM42249.1 MAG: peptidoglycan endopeptidase [Rhodanobacter sp.]TAN26472.1 MAG: peptidoglycan endopeptidase [Rhodanobacter sp.]
MPIKRLTVLAVLAPALLLSGSLYASGAQSASSLIISAPVAANVASSLLHPLPAFTPASGLGQSVLPDNVQALLASVAAPGSTAAAAIEGQADGDQSTATSIAKENITDLRKALLAAAMGLRDIRYVRGGHNPSTGFDCSGFVRYVFAHAIGLQLPNNSAAQFMAGIKVKRSDMKPGDLVFFHTGGRHRISHVGIYISNGRFIHSPTTGKSVEISSLDNDYWAKRFAGAKRPEAIALAANRG